MVYYSLRIQVNRSRGKRIEQDPGTFQAQSSHLPSTSGAVLTFPSNIVQQYAWSMLKKRHDSDPSQEEVGDARFGHATQNFA
jgi:hypothetical protein